MMEDQTKQPEPEQTTESVYTTRSQERHTRWMAKQAAREARHAAREARRVECRQRPHRDWSFEMKLGEKVYSFNWRWHPAEPQTEAPAAEETQTPAPESEAA